MGSWILNFVNPDVIIDIIFFLFQTIKRVIFVRVYGSWPYLPRFTLSIQSTQILSLMATLSLRGRRSLSALSLSLFIFRAYCL